MRPLGAGRNPDDMPGAPTRPTGTHPDLVHIKSSLAKSPGEIRVWRPKTTPPIRHRQTQRRAGGAQSLQAHTARHWLFGSVPCGTVIDIEQDRIECRPVGPDQAADVCFADADARISQALTEDLHHRTSSPCHDGRHQLGDDDSSICSECGKRGTKGEAHAQVRRSISAAASRASNSLASNRRERLFGSAETAVHQFVVHQT